MQSPPTDLDRFGGIVPRPAPVTPRVRTTPGGAALPLEHHIRGLLRAGSSGIVNLYGESGSGKTAAVEHIAHVFRDEPRLVICDANASVLTPAPLSGTLVIITSVQRNSQSAIIALEMADWTDDDLIEYLAGSHRQRVQAVMQRVAESPDRDLLRGHPLLWRIVLDAMAADNAHADVTDALRWHINLEIPDQQTRKIASVYALAELAMTDPSQRLPSAGLPQFEPRLRRLLIHPSVQLALASELLLANLCEASGPSYLAHPLSRDLILQTARLASRNQNAAQALLTRVRDVSHVAQSNSVSLLHAMQIGWKPESGFVPYLAVALLDGANWPDVNLERCAAPHASFRGADLTRARLDKSRISMADFSSACLREASLDHALAHQAIFTACDLTGASVKDVAFQMCNFHRAKLNRCNLYGADFQKADLREAQLRDANLSWAKLSAARIDGADFSGANLAVAVLTRQNLSTAQFTGANFSRALMGGCNLEYMELPQPDFSQAILDGAYMTGSIFPGANFAGADLRNTGLADVEWENSNLRGADFTDSSFHAGSTRCGLVGSTIAGEGSKTGFYTDDFNDRDFKSPEEIRKANLCGCDLRGAKTDGVDFYLVDLRRARYSNAQAKWFRRCGAIL